MSFKLRSLLSAVGRNTGIRRRSRQPRLSAESLETRSLLAAYLGFAAGFEGGVFASATDVATDGNQNVYSIGHFSGSTDFDPGAGTDIFTSQGAAAVDGFISKIDANGNHVTAGHFSSADDVDPQGLAIDGLGNIYVTGHFHSETDVDPGAGVSLLAGKAGDVFLLKLDSSLNLVWARRFGGSGNMDVVGVALDKSGNPFLAGSFSKTIDFDPGAGEHKLTAGGQRDSYLMKLDTDGDFRRVSQFESTAGERNEIAAFDVDGGGNAYVAGDFTGTTDFDPKAAVSNLTSNGGRDVFVTKLDRGGRLTWARQIGGNGRDEATAVAVDQQRKDVYFASTHIGLVDLDPGPATDNRTTNSNQISTGHEAFVSRLDSSGTHAWSNQYVEQNGETAITGLDVGTDSDVYVAGAFSGTVDFDPGSGTENRSSSLGDSVFAARYDRQGDFVWAEAGGSGTANNVHVGSDGAVHTGGLTQGGDFDPGSDTEELDSGGFVWQLIQTLDHTVSPAVHNILVRRNVDIVEIVNDDTSDVLASSVIDATAGIRLDGTETSGLNVTIDQGVGGTFDFPLGIEFDSSPDTDDELRLVGGTGLSTEYRPTTGTPGTSKLVVDMASDVTFTGVELVSLSSLKAATLRTNGLSDTLDATATKDLGGGAFAMRIEGAGGTTITPLRLFDTESLTVQTNGGNDEVSFDQKSLNTRGLQNLTVDSGTGRDEVSIVAKGLGLDVAGGAFTFNAGDGPDTLSVRGDTDYEINSNRLISATAGSIFFTGLEVSEITGGAGHNKINGRLFDGDLVLKGLDGNDTLIGGLGNDALIGGPGHDEIKGREGHDQLNGSAGNDMLLGNDGHDMVSGDTGDDTVLGLGGNDTLTGGDGADDLDGGAGNDALNGDSGADTLFVDATDDANQLNVRLIATDVVAIFHLPPGDNTQLERDVLEQDAADELFVQLLGGNDILDVAANVSLDGTVDGGAGTDTCTAPDNWTSVSC